MQSSLNGRVLHVGKFYPPFRGGMETYLADLIDEQRRQGLYAIGLVHGQPQADDPSWLHRVPVQAQILYAPLGISFPFTLRRLIRQFEPDVLHLHMPNNAVFWALLMPLTRKVPWVVHWHSDVVRSHIRRLVSIAYDWLYEPFERAVLRHAQRIIVTSPSYLEASKPLAPWREKVQVIPLGLTQQAQQHAGADGPDAGADWRQGALRLFSLGRLTYYKGFETLIQAVSGMPEVQLLIAGAGDMRADLERLIRESTPAGQDPAVRLLGPVTEEHKHRLLASCDVFCLASRERTEAFGLAVLEAMQHGRPCIVSDLHGSGLPWLVTQSGSGLLATVEDVASWRTAIERLKADPALRRKLGAAGHRAALGRFSITRSAEQVTSLYASIAPEVFFQAPVKDRLNLILIGSDDPLPQVEALLNTLQQAGWRDFLLLGHAHQRRALKSMMRGDAALMTPALQLSDWNSLQAGIRFALRNGYRSVLTLGADAASTPQAALELVHGQARADQCADLLIGTARSGARQGAVARLVDRWVSPLTGVSLKTLESRLRLYQHDAMVIASSREATLLDHDDIGALLLMRKARLRIAEVAVRSPVSADVTLRRVFASVFALVLFRLSSWSIRRRSVPSEPT